jgi:hypothetical protein
MIDAKLFLGGDGPTDKRVPAPGTPPLLDRLKDPVNGIEGWWIVEWQGHPKGALAAHLSMARDEAGWRYDIYFHRDGEGNGGTISRITGEAAVGADGSVLLKGDYICFNNDRCYLTDDSSPTTVRPDGADAKRGVWRAEDSSGPVIWRRAPPPLIRSVKGLSVEFDAPSPWYLSEIDSAAYGER